MDARKLKDVYTDKILCPDFFYAQEHRNYQLPER